MKLLVVLFALAAVAYSKPGETYNPEYDNFNAKELVENERLLKNYGKCFLGEGPCTREGADIRKVIPEALRTQCGKCTPAQKELVRTVVRAFQEKLPDIWKQLHEKEDPKGEFKQSFEEFINSKSD